MWETQVWSLGQEDPLGKEMATHSSTLAWKIPWTEECGRLQSMGWQRIGHDWATSLSLQQEKNIKNKENWNRILTFANNKHDNKQLARNILCTKWCVCSVASVMSDSLRPMDHSLPGSSVHGIFPARILEWVTMFSSKSFPDPGIKSTSPASPALQMDSLLLSHWGNYIPNNQFSSVAQSCLTLCDPMDCNMPGLPIHHQLLELDQTHVHQVGDAILPSHPLSSLSPPAFNLSQHQGLFQGVTCSHQVAKVL